jgi:drug/metabolite transporter (DMT)-like permease
MVFILLRFSLAALIFIPWKWREIFPLKKEHVIPGVILGAILFFSFAAQTFGLKFTSATKSGFITGSSVVMIPILQTTLEKRLPTIGAAIGTVLVFTGILFLSSGGGSLKNFLDELGGNFNLGDALTVLCAIAYAFYVVYLDMVSGRMNIWTLVFYQIIVTVILSSTAALVFSASGLEPLRLNFTGDLALGIFYTAIFATLITTILQTKYQRFVTPTKAGIIFSFEPIFAAAIAYFAINEKITNFGLIGSVLVFTGLIISESYDIIFLKNGRSKS